jgi:deoxycytidylate deaminase
MKDERIKVFKQFTLNLATLSKCSERNVAAIITDRQLTQVYSIGVNGGPKGLDNCMCKTDGKYGCTHAEINALIKNRANDTDKIMFITLAPCKQCAAAIINSPGGFSVVYYFEDWKEDSGIKLLKAANIQVVRI